VGKTLWYWQQRAGVNRAKLLPIKMQKEEDVKKNSNITTQKTPL